MSRLPSRVDKVRASFFPSGDHAGAWFTPARADTRRRSPVFNSWTYTVGSRPSKDTYARLWPSGDQEGDINGSLDCITIRGFMPSASATTSWYDLFGRCPRTET